jgi:hypothetical protein
MENLSIINKMDLQLPIFIAGLVLSVIGFFLVKFYNSVERLNAGVNKILVSLAKNDEVIKKIEAEVHDLKERMEGDGERLRQVELKIAKL